MLGPVALCGAFDILEHVHVNFTLEPCDVNSCHLKLTDYHPCPPSLNPPESIPHIIRKEVCKPLPLKKCKCSLS